MNLTVVVAGTPYPYRFEKHAENAYFIKVSTLTVGKVWKAKDEWTAHVRAACTYAHALSGWIHGPQCNLRWHHAKNYPRRCEQTLEGY